MNKKSLLRSNNKFHFTSLGCARNLVDSEVMIGLLLKKGLEITPEIEEADFLIVNTCGFLEAARKEALEVIDEIFQEKKKSAKVIVAGCMVQKHSDLLKTTFPNIHHMIGSGDVEKIVEAVQTKEMGSSITSAKSYLEMGEIPRAISTPNHYAYLKIAEGCKKRCAFCIIPTIKGQLKSKTNEQVLKEFKALLSQGIKEIILIAQDLGDFGKDRKEKNGLTLLLKQILEIKQDFWLRLLYLYPDEITDELIEVIQSDKRICPYLDMPLQHINDDVLKAMHRKTSRKQIIEIITNLRKKLPDITIRTSLMVGYPGETKQQFEELLDFVKTYQLDNIGVFKFSKEKEAFAANLENQIPENVKQKRFKKLTKAQFDVVLTKNQQKIGQVLDCFVEGFHPDSEYLLRARHKGQCPDIDGQIIITDGRLVNEFGKLYKVRITDFSDYDLIGEVIAVCEEAPRQNKLKVLV
ncbi:MAG: 30S ribosomal protein S12 methylthiotransferase RimO [Chlamydiota bacterium]|jgi:ribosomal protein S12 methylthiotransferase